MRFWVIAALVLCVALAMPGMASAAVFLGFDELSHGTVLNTQYAAQGVVFSNSHGNLLVSDDTPGPPFTPHMAVLAQNYTMPLNKSRATFSVPVTEVSVCLGDYDQDSDYIYLNLYDATSTWLASDSDMLEAALNGGKTLSAVAPAGKHVAFAEFWGVGVNNNSVYFDNFRFEVEETVIPEPASLIVWSVLGAVGVAITWYRRKRAA